MRDTYRGFEIERIAGGSLYQIFEGGKLIDDAASETAAYDKIDTLLTKRRMEDIDENRRNYRQ